MLGKGQQGISLIESMIALLVISVGLLGLAALQVTSISQNASALNHSRAAWIAYNMADRIRANGNPDQYVAAYNNIDTDNDYQGNCLASACSGAQMATADAAEWSALVRVLPSGRGQIVANNAAGLRITVMWDDEGTGAVGTGCGPDPELDMACYTVVVAVPPAAPPLGA